MLEQAKCAFTRWFEQLRHTGYKQRLRAPGSCSLERLGKGVTQYGPSRTYGVALES